MDTRRATRVRAKANLPVSFDADDLTVSGPLLDFSPLGLSARTPQEVPVGTILRLSVPVDSEIFHATAVVRARVPGGIGVEFLAMTPIDHNLLDRLYLYLLMAASA